VIDGLHLLRPDALWALLALPLIALLLLRRKQRTGSWQQEIDPELLPWLLPGQQSGQQRRQGHWWLLLLFAVAVVAIAGPSLQRAEVPVFQRADALVIVLDLSDSMRARDIQPSRAQRALQKVVDVLAEREEGVTGLVAFAGDAHVVTPLTDDRRTIENLLPSLTPDIMPIPGSDASAALREAIELITAAGMANGHILLITDGMPRFDAEDIAAELLAANIDMGILGVGTAQGAPMPLPEGGFIRDNNGEIVVPVLDSARLSNIAGQLGARYREVSLDDSDIASLMAPTTAELKSGVSLDRRTDTWIDQGFVLALLLAAGLLPLFRRGLLLWLVALSLPSPSTQAQSLWDDLWQTPDQQAAAALAAGDAASAAQSFTHPAWRSTSQFSAGNYSSAAEGFAGLENADGAFNQGNALAMQGDYQSALEAFEQSLELDPGRGDAEKNRDLMKQLLEQQEQEQQQEEQDNEQSEQDQDQQDGNQQSSDQQSSDQQSQQSDEQSADNQSSKDSAQRPDGDVAEENQGEAGEEMQEAMEQRLEEQTAMQMRKFDEALEEQQKLEQWLRRVPDEPGGLLRNKFRYQAIQRLRNGETPDESIRW
jgi:Ca-activated chloride channel family protein